MDHLGMRIIKVIVDYWYDGVKHGYDTSAGVFMAFFALQNEAKDEKTKLNHKVTVDDVS
jgi:hypothetical protein